MLLYIIIRVPFPNKESINYSAKKNDATTRTISHKYKPNILNINIYEYYLELESEIYLMLFSFLDDQKEENDYLFIYKILIFELQKIFVMKRFEKKYKLNIYSI